MIKNLFFKKNIHESDALALKSLCKRRAPQDFDSLDIMFEMHYVGLCDNLLSSGFLCKDKYGDVINLDQETMKKIDAFVGNSDENLIYYNLLRACILILKKYLK